MSDEPQILNFRNVVAHGVDIVDISDFSRLVIDKKASEFLGRYFTVAELAAADKGGDKTERLASRFAIKEAVLKALGTGWGDGVAFTDVEVVTLRSGAPSIVLHRRLKTISSGLGIAHWLASASHTGTIAIGSVIALKE
ncbi:holo-ACP synthase [Methyloversatilis sp. MC4-4]|uniref:holo-ACP synthase n=1 Tax=Methyloversatilis sp. MC4-4 TaxID=3132824 RepID=UPI003CEAD380